jgi:DNA (cytosine-5)-methyltransferase 1
LKHIGLFEGIGGFSVAAESMGWGTIAWCEWNQFCKQILKHHYPNANEHDDITKTDFTIYRGKCDILTGGFPCQPFSVAGKQLGSADDRHLWPEMLRAIREVKPRWVIGENVPGLISWSDGLVFEQVLSDLEAEGYEVWPCVLPAASVNAPHKRDRVWVIAYANGIRKGSGLAGLSKKNGEISKRYKDPKFGDSSHGLTKNTHSTGLQTPWPKQQAAGTIGSGIQWATPDSPSKGLQRREDFGSTGSSRADNNQQLKRCFQPTWQNFPTQSPVCIGDYGLPTDALRQRIREDSMGALSEKEIDKIISEAVNYHRKESIKAGGNAIVPQIAIQIFKAIEQYEKSSNTRTEITHT